MKNRIIYILGIIVILTGMFGNSLVYADEAEFVDVEDATNSELGNGFDQGIIEGLKNQNTNPVFSDQIYRIWNTFKWCVWVLSFVGIFAAGVRYIFAGVDAKADLKQGLGKLVIGIIFVDLASLIIEFIVKVFYDII